MGPLALLLIGGAAVAVVASSDDGPRREPQRVGGPPPPKVEPEVIEGETTIRYEARNAGGVIGGLVPFGQSDHVDLIIPTAGMPQVGGVMVAVYKMVKQYTGGKKYPDSWTETQGQITEVTAFGVPKNAPGARVSVVVELYSCNPCEPEAVWHACSRRTFNADNVNVSTIVRNNAPDYFNPTSDAGRIACLYARRKYEEAGLHTDLRPLPGAPGEMELHLRVTEEAGQRRVGLYLWLPPRLGQYQAQVRWRIWPRGD